MSHLKGWCRGTMFALEVNEEMTSWPEQDTYERKWVSPVLLFPVVLSLYLSQSVVCKLISPLLLLRTVDRERGVGGLPVRLDA